MAATYLPILFAFLLALLVATIVVTISVKVGPSRPSATKSSVYECGMPPVGGAHQRFSVKFYLVAVLFILFDLEAVFVYPWAVVFRDFLAAGAGAYIFLEMAFFLLVLFLGWYYVLRRGALDWD